MHSVLQVSEMAIQDMADHLVQVLSLSKPLLRDSVVNVLREHDQSITDVLLNELVEDIMKTNVFVSATTKGAELSTPKAKKNIC